MHSPTDVDVAAPNPSTGERDLYLILGYLGIGAIGLTTAAGFLLVPEPAYWWHVPFSAVLAVASLGPFVAAWGLARAHRRAGRRARRRSADMFRGRHLGER